MPRQPPPWGGTGTAPTRGIGRARRWIQPPSGLKGGSFFRSCTLVRDPGVVRLGWRAVQEQVAVAPEHVGPFLPPIYQVMNMRSLPMYPRPLEASAKHTTCFPGSELRLPQGYTKGRRPETPAFLRFIASSGNVLRHGGKSLCVAHGQLRDVCRAIRRRPWRLIPTRTLGISRRPGYRLFRAFNRSEHWYPDEKPGSVVAHEATA